MQRAGGVARLRSTEPDNALPRQFICCSPHPPPPSSVLGSKYFAWSLPLFFLSLLVTFPFTFFAHSLHFFPPTYSLFIFTFILVFVLYFPPPLLLNLFFLSLYNYFACFPLPFIFLQYGFFFTHSTFHLFSYIENFVHIIWVDHNLTICLLVILLPPILILLFPPPPLPVVLFACMYLVVLPNKHTFSHISLILTPFSKACLLHCCHSIPSAALHLPVKEIQ